LEVLPLLLVALAAVVVLLEQRLAALAVRAVAAQTLVELDMVVALAHQDKVMLVEQL
jgi:hypothetical protein